MNMKQCIADYIALAQAKVRNLMCRATRGLCSLRDSQRKSFFAWACARFVSGPTASNLWHFAIPWLRVPEALQVQHLVVSSSLHCPSLFCTISEAGILSRSNLSRCVKEVRSRPRSRPMDSFLEGLVQGRADARSENVLLCVVGRQNFQADCPLLTAEPRRSLCATLARTAAMCLCRKEKLKACTQASQARHWSWSYAPLEMQVCPANVIFRSCAVKLCA